mgnify:CR=1 FL=1
MLSRYLLASNACSVRARSTSEMTADEPLLKLYRLKELNHLHMLLFLLQHFVYESLIILLDVAYTYLCLAI